MSAEDMDVPDIEANAVTDATPNILADAAAHTPSTTPTTMLASPARSPTRSPIRSPTRSAARISARSPARSPVRGQMVSKSSAQPISLSKLGKRKKYKWLLLKRTKPTAAKTAAKATMMVYRSTCYVWTDVWGCLKRPRCCKEKENKEMEGIWTKRVKKS
jgi:hypothetical protein